MAIWLCPAWAPPGYLIELRADDAPSSPSAGPRPYVGPPTIRPAEISAGEDA